MATEAAALPVTEMDARDDGGSNEPNGDAVDAMAVDGAKEEVENEVEKDEDGEQEEDGDKEEDEEEKDGGNEGEGEGEDEDGSDGDAAQQTAARRQVR